MTNHEIHALSTTTPKRITPNGTHSGMDITIQNINNLGFIFVGGSDVSASSYGYRLLPNHAISFELSGEDALYLVGQYADMNAAVLQINLEQGT